MTRSASFSVRRVLALIMTCGLLAPLALTACSSSQPPPPQTPMKMSQQASEYIIGPGDSLSIFVYRAPDLSLPSVEVRPDGRISVPLIQDITAAGLTPAALAKDIEARLKKYIQDPNVTVIVRSFVGPFDRQIRVIGEATDPMAIPYREHMTLLDVMIATKGLTKFAAGNRAIIVRREPDGKTKTIHVHIADLIKNGDIAQNVEMRPGDTLIIPQSWF